MQFVLPTRLALISLLLLGLSACGGDGSDPKPSPSPAPSSTATSSASSITALPVTQNFTFTQVGPLNLLAGDVLTNQASGDGSGAVTYISSNTAVATVASNGLLNVVGAGDAIITASKAADSKYLAASASYTIHATSVAQTISFAQSGPVSLFAGDSLANPATGPGSGAITYHSSNTNVAAVDDNGLVSINVIGTGSAVISASKAADPHYYAASASYTINATGRNQIFNFAQPGSISVLQDSIFLNPATGEGTGTIFYSSSNTNVAVAGADGQVTVIGAGSALITATKMADSLYLAATNSYDIYSQAISFADTGVLYGFVGGYQANPVTSQGSGALTFSSSDTSVASVNSDGLVSLLSEGSALITATKAADANYLAASTSYVINVARSNQFVTFSQTGPIDLVAGATLTNQATAQGTGALTYSSSDTSVATVDSNGLVTVTGGGSAVITATVAADTKYLGATATYTIDAGIVMTAWVGSNDTLIDFSAGTTGLELYRSTTKTCDITNYPACANGQMSLLTGSTVTDTAVRLNRAGYYVLKKGNQQAALSVKVDLNNSSNKVYGQFGYRYNQQTVVFNNKVWMIGGSDRENDVGLAKNDIWSSLDGVTWTKEVEHTPFSARYGHRVIVFNNKLWLIGGSDATSGILQDDAWSSTDGINWVQETDEANMHSYDEVLVVFNNKVWKIGTVSRANGAKNDIWSTTDFITWTQENPSAAFSARRGHAVVAYNNQLWLLGGGVANEVWSSNDGITWILQTANAAFSTGRSFPGLVVYNNKLWLIGGNTSFGNANDVWSSSDGILWTQQAANAPFSGRNSHSVVNFKNQLLMLGGYDQNFSTQGENPNDAWVSTDGIEWRVGYRETFKLSQ